LTTAASEATAARVRTRRALSAPQLATAVEDLTRFRWTWEGYD
jgi:3-phenylpropionate/cinnamic acid dioxygenase small subunit